MVEFKSGLTVEVLESDENVRTPFCPFSTDSDSRVTELLDTDVCSVVLADGIPGLFISVTAQAS